MDGCSWGLVALLVYLFLLCHFLLLSGGTDIGEVGNDLLCVLSLACTGFTTALEQSH